MTDIKEGMLLWFTNFLIKSPQVVVLIRMQIIKHWLKNYINQLLENLKKEQFTRDSKTIWEGGGGGGGG